MPHSSTVAISDTAAVAVALTRLGLAETALSVSAHEGVAHRLNCTENDPYYLKGTIASGKTTRALRERLAPLGWKRALIDGQERTVRPDGKVAIVVASGDAETGLDGGPAIWPTTNSAKGKATRAAIRVNGVVIEQGTLEFGEAHLRAVDSSGDEATVSLDMLTYVLLYFVDEDADVIRLELSLPETIDAQGYVSAWRERILLNPVSILDSDGLDREDEQSVEHDPIVERRLG